MKEFTCYIQHNVMDCGPTCLCMVAALYGKRYSLEGLREKRSSRAKACPCRASAFGSDRLHSGSQSLKT